MKNRFGKSRRLSKGALGMVMTVGFLIALMLLFNMGVNHLVSASEQEALESVRNAVTRAMIQFYAIEGYYPPSLDYLIDRYGIQVDRDRFIVHYNAFASNIRPQVIIMPRDF